MLIPPESLSLLSLSTALLASVLGGSTFLSDWLSGNITVGPFFLSITPAGMSSSNKNYQAFTNLFEVFKEAAKDEQQAESEEGQIERKENF